MRRGPWATLGFCIVVGVGCVQARAEQLPPCTFESCPVCLPPWQQAPRNVSIRVASGVYRQAAFRIGRCNASWDSQSIFATALGILIAERLGIRVEYVHCGDGSQCYLAVNNCTGWQGHKCDVLAAGDLNSGTKVFADELPDIMFASEVLATVVSAEDAKNSALVYDDRPAVSLGPTGYSVSAGLYMYREAADEALRNEGLHLLWMQALQFPSARKYFHPPRRLIERGVQAEVPTCSSTSTVQESVMEEHRRLGWNCSRETGWWLTPACMALGDRWVFDCLVVVEDDWGYPKPDLYMALVNSGVPVAKLTAGYSVWQDLVRRQVYNVTFTWFAPDATFQMRPRRISFLPEDEQPPAVVLKVAHGPSLEAEPSLRYLLETAALSQRSVGDLMARISAAVNLGNKVSGNLYQKVACDWIRESQATWTPWLPDARTCWGGRVFDEAVQECVPCRRGSHAGTSPNGTKLCRQCPAGSFGADEGAVECASCPAGFFQDQDGASACRSCMPGSAQAAPGQTACSACKAGSAAVSLGSAACSPCAPGTFTAGGGAASCSACGTGTFASDVGSVACTPCGGGLVTAGRGSVDRSDCTCPGGEFMARDNSSGQAAAPRCEPCPDGRLCPPGSDESRPESMPLHPGFMARLDDPFTVYSCLSKVECPGGAPGTCGPLRDPSAIACGRCVPGAYEKGGTCIDCQPQDVLPVVCTGLAAFVLLVGSVVFARSDFHGQTQIRINVISVFGLAVTCAQTFVIFRGMKVTWPPLLDALIEAVSFLNFDLRLLRVGCLVSAGPPLVFAFRQGIPWICVLICAAVVLLKKALRPRIRLKVELTNVVGQLLNIFFISIVVSCAVPLVCYSHPEGHGASVLMAPSVLCRQGTDYNAMLAVGIVSFCTVPLPFFAYASFCCLVYPRHASSGTAESMRWLQLCRFLFFRYKSERYFYAAILLLRSLVVTLLPALVEGVAAQVCLLSASISAFTVLQLSLSPWRLKAMNVLDGSLSMCLTTLLLFTAMASDFHAEAQEAAIHWLVLLTLIAFAKFCAGSLLAIVLWHFRVQPAYELFVCHHKADAQAQARLLKMRLRTETGKTVFIDSDDLLELDGLFDLIKTKVGTVIAYLTRDTLRRAWCAGEVTTAFKRGVPVVAVKCPVFVPPTGMEIMDTARYVDGGGCNLNQFGISFEDVAKAFEALLSEDTPCVAVPSEVVGRARFEVMFKQLMCELAAPKLKGRMAQAAFRRNSRKKSHATQQFQDAVSGHLNHASGRVKAVVAHISTVGVGIQNTIPSPRNRSNSRDYTKEVSMPEDAVVLSSQPRDDEASAAAAIVMCKLQQHKDLVATLKGGVVCLADHPERHVALHVLNNARIVLVLLSPGTLACLEQLNVMVHLMELQETLLEHNQNGRPNFLPVSLPNFFFPDTSFYETVLPKMWPGADANVEVSLQAFFRVIAASLTTGASNQTLDLQVQQIAARIPMRPRKVAGFSRGRTSSILRHSVSPCPSPRVSGYESNEEGDVDNVFGSEAENAGEIVFRSEMMGSQSDSDFDEEVRHV